MIWQLAEKVQEFLHKYNQPPSQSFYDQMLNNKKEQMERNREIEKKKEEYKVECHGTNTTACDVSIRYC